ncbi:MAG: MATE family efflux transporter [Ruminococcaceae bacterium]|nr:MATE family efflux transporter [Oscillospiraceae bacterium]
MHHFHLRSHGHGESAVLDMTVGTPYKIITKFAMPILLSQVFQQLYNTADSLIVGQFLGTDALAAVSSSGNLIFLLVSFFTGMSMGSGIAISRYFGAKNDEKVSQAVHTNIAFSLLSGILLTVVGVLFTPTILEWMNTDKEVMDEAVEYFRYYFLGALALVMYNNCRGILNAVGDSRRPLYYLIVSSILNVLLDLLFIAGFGWGVWSAALATVISQVVSVVLCMIYLMKKGNVFTVEPKKIRFHRAMLIETVKYGLPSGVQNSVIAFANVIVQSQINSFGKLATAAYGTHAKIEGFAFLPIMSFTMGISTFISQNLGAAQYDRAKKGARFGIITSVSMAELIGVLCFIFAPQLVSLFDSNPGVIEYGVKQAHTVALFYGLLAFSHAIAAVCRGAGKAFVPMTIMLAVWCVLRIVYITVVMSLFKKIEYIYPAYPLTWFVSSVIYLIYYTCSDWVHGFEKKQKKGKVRANEA